MEVLWRDAIMVRLLFVVFGAMALLLLGGVRLLSPSVEAGDEPAAPATFSGKPILILAKDGVGYTLVKAGLRQLGNRSFVVSQEMKDSPYHLTKERFGGGTVWVPVDSVTEIVELEAPPKREK
jgi:hypothetical protein